MAVGGYDKADEAGARGVKMCVLDEVGVDDGVEKVIVDGVVDMRVLVVIDPRGGGSARNARRGRKEWCSPARAVGKEKRIELALSSSQRLRIRV